MSATRKPRLVIDARMAGQQGHGIGLYVQQLAQGLAALDLPYEPFYLIPPDCPRNSSLRQQPHAECEIPFLHKTELVKLSSVIRRFGPALFHTPSFSSLLKYPCPHVQTVHDLNHLHFGSVAQKAYYRLILQRSLTKARAVISVSETAAAEIRHWLKGQKIEVAPNAVETFPEQDDKAVLHRFGLEKENFFFALSNPKPHKNVDLLEKAYTQALEVRSLPPLVLNVPGISPQGIVHTGPLQDFEVGALLRNAKAFYFPSVYEGFGRPPVEAALSGTVPVVSSLPVHREVLAGVSETIFLDPTSIPAWKESFLRMAQQQTLGGVSEKSRDWIRSTWSVTNLAARMDSIYRRCLEQ